MNSSLPPGAAVIGAGPAGLMAAETLSARGVPVTVFDRMPSAGRKLLMAGRGGLNLTHSEPFKRFIDRYGTAGESLRPILERFPPAAVVAWAEGLGQSTFVGSSGRVFPRAMKASPLLRAWLARLSAQGVAFRLRRDWRGWTEDGALAFSTPEADLETFHPAATVLALGGASWPRLGSNGAWTGVLGSLGVAVTPLAAANSGFTVAWSPTFAARFAGAPLKNLRLSFAGRSVRGEALITAYGIEGGAVYALSADLRAAIGRDGDAILAVDLAPDLSVASLAGRLRRGRVNESGANRLRKAGISPVAANLLREAGNGSLPADPSTLAEQIKAVGLRLTGVAPLERAISTAGGVALAGLDDRLMLRRLPGVFAAGEMLDWEAPTGGYLLQACFATGHAAAEGALGWLDGLGPSAPGAAADPTSA